MKQSTILRSASRRTALKALIAAPAALSAVSAWRPFSAGAQEAEHRADEHANERATHVVIPRQLVPEAVGQAQHPLSHGHVGKHVIEQMGGALSHPAAAATRTNRAAFA